ncbi:hypothetical protein [Desulfopila aestuarii]|uniref:Uncharacterized protein n=1 Tax=Desulfopila aestuarii DSM 18488 TaxID=1121416 RepID=A0A1M7YJM8_9BACT|nr:hypothetical protein [Desulfopila aestuarii]SHO52829.1 hypothetical protein SAMN02745220_04789 [Desulfopila aestuarii DSM 18488]
MGEVVGTLVVRFGESVASVSGDIVAEWDDTLNVESSGEVKSRFVPGDEAWLLIHADPGLQIVRVAATHGSVNASGQVVQQRSQDIGFGGVDDGQDLRYLPAASIVGQWLGRVGVGLQIAGRRLTVQDGFPCLLRASYPVRFRRYRLQTPAMTLNTDETYPLLVYIYYTEAGA